MKTRSLKRFHFSFKTFALLFLCVTLLTGLLPENVSAASSIGLSAYAPRPGNGTITISWNKVSNASFYAYSVRDTTTNASICDRTQTSKAYAKVSHTWEAGHSYRVWAGACCEGNDPDNTSTWDYTGMTTFTVEACAHSNTDIAWDTSRSITYTSVSDTQHKMKGYQYEYCTNCFEHIGSSFKVSLAVEHDFDENGDCPSCGYTHACAHTRTKLVEIDGYPAYIQDSETKHIVDIQYKRVCRDCDAVVDKLVDSERVYQREDHDFNSKGVCRDCGYVKPAQQEPLKISVSASPSSAETGATLSASATASGGDGNYSFSWKVTCDGSVVVNTDLSYGSYYSYTASKAGSYVFTATVRDGNGNQVSTSSGTLTVKAPACQHPSTEIAWDTSRAITYKSVSDQAHSMTGYQYKYCTVCFERVGDSFSASETVSHDFDSNGDCPSCGYTHACPHTRTNLVALDGYPAYRPDSETQHIVDIQYKEVCSDCNAVVNKLVDSARVYKREDHNFNENGTCRSCGYVKPAQQEPLKISVSASPSSAETGAALSASAAASGGDGNYSFSWKVTCDGNVVANTDLSYGSSYNHTASKAGSYVFTATVRDGSGNQVSASSGALTVKAPACQHPSTEIAWDTSRAITYKSVSDQTHTMTGYQYKYCTVCFERVGDSFSASETVSHNFDSNGKCSSCGYTQACQHTKTKRVENTGKRATKLTPKSETEHEVTTTKYYELRCAACNAYIRDDDSEKTTVAKPHDFGNGNTCACGYKKVTKTETTKEAPYVLGFSMSETEIEVGNTVTFTLNIANAKDGAKLAIEMRADDQFTINKEVTVKNGKASCIHEFSNTGNRSIKFRVAGGEYCAAKTLKVLSKKPGESKIIKVAVVPPINAVRVEKKDGETFAVSVVCNADTVCVEMYFGKEHNQDTYRSSSSYVEANGTRTFTLTYTLGGNGKRYAGDYPITVSPFSYVDADWTKNQMGATVNAGTLKVTHDMNGDEQCIACGYAGKWVDPGKDGNWKTKAPNVAYPNKDDKMLTCDETGEIRYVEQKWSSGNSGSYRDEYWTDVDQSEGKCTRAASSMALSYMGIDVLPKDMGNHCTTGYEADAKAKDSSCKTRGESTNYAGKEYEMTYDEFLDLYNDYASDEEGKYSPVVIHTVRWVWSKNDKKFVQRTHAFIVVGHDQSNPDYFYVVDPGHGNNGGTGRIKLTQEGQMRVADYQCYKDGKWTSLHEKTRYADDCNLIGVWQYYKEG